MSDEKQTLLTNNILDSVYDALIVKRQSIRQIKSYLNIKEAGAKNKRLLDTLKAHLISLFKNGVSKDANKKIIALLKNNDIRGWLNFSGDDWIAWAVTTNYHPRVCQLIVLGKEFYIKTMHYDLTAHKKNSPHLNAGLNLQVAIAQTSGGFWNRDSVKKERYLKSWVRGGKYDAPTCIAITNDSRYWQIISPGLIRYLVFWVKKKMVLEIKTLLFYHRVVISVMFIFSIS